MFQCRVCILWPQEMGMLIHNVFMYRDLILRIHGNVLLLSCFEVEILRFEDPNTSMHYEKLLLFRKTIS